MAFSNDLFFAPAHKLAAMLRAREVSSTEMVSAFIERIESVNHGLNAVVTLVEERAAGAVIIAKTNLPEMAMDYDCDNPVFGATNNPWNHARVPGGSSGGEAAALATGMSPLGLG